MNNIELEEERLINEIFRPLQEHIVFSTYQNVDDVNFKMEEISLIFDEIKSRTNSIFDEVKENLIMKEFDGNDYYIPPLAIIVEKAPFLKNAMRKIDEDLYNAVLFSHDYHVKTKLNTIFDETDDKYDEIKKMLKTEGLLFQGYDIYFPETDTLIQRGLDRMEYSLMMKEWIDFLYDRIPLSKEFRMKQVWALPNESDDLNIEDIVSFYTEEKNKKEAVEEATKIADYVHYHFSIDDLHRARKLEEYKKKV